jgi:phospholipid/cholesterol/gamma-HCH transport system substrate-binding protein
METRANYALVGAFTLAVIAAAFGFVYWFASGNTNGEKQQYRVVFTGSVSGLVKGSSVRFNGIRVGEVTAIDFVPNDPGRVQAIIDVAPNTPVKTDTRARLEYTGLTGQASIQLSGGEPTAGPLSAPEGLGVPTIFADRSDFQDLLEAAQRIAGRTDAVLTRVEKVLGDAEPSIGNTVRSVETFARALSDNSAGVGAFLATISDTGEKIASLSTRLEGAVTAAEGVIRAVDPRAVSQIVSNLEATSQTIADNRATIDGILDNGGTAAQRLADAAGKVDATLADVQRLTQSLDADRVNRAVANVEQFTATLSNNAPQVERVLKDAAEITTSLKGIDTQRVNSIIASTDRFASVLADNSGSINGILNDGALLTKRLADASARIETTVVEIEKLARAVNADGINRAVGNVERFTGVLGDNAGTVDSALKDVAEITRSLRGTTEKLDRVLVAAENFLGSNQGAGQGVFAEINETARTFRVLAENLDKRTSEITAGLNRLTGSGARDLQALAADTRRVVNELNATVRSLGRDPSQLIRGGRSGIPEYSGSR